MVQIGTTLHARAESQNVRQPPVFTAPLLPVRAQVVMLVQIQTLRWQTRLHVYAELRLPRVMLSQVFTAPPLPARALAVVLARAWMGPHSTPSTALAGQQYVIRSMACSATHPTINAHVKVVRRMVPQCPQIRLYLYQMYHRAHVATRTSIVQVMSFALLTVVVEHVKILESLICHPCLMGPPTSMQTSVGGMSAKSRICHPCLLGPPTST